MIAKALGMSKANLYHYCSSKEDLFYKIHLDYLEKHLIPIIEEAEQLSDPRDRIASVLKQLTLLNARKACRCWSRISSISTGVIIRKSFQSGEGPMTLSVIRLRTQTVWKNR